MGFFSSLNVLFGIGAQPKHKDRVYMNKLAKYKGLYGHIQQTVATRDVWVVAHFAASLEEVKRALAVMGINAVEVTGRSVARAATPGGVHLVGAEHFAAHAEASWLSGQPPVFLITEHHPLPDPDAALVDRMRELAPTAEVCFYSDLDEPFFEEASGKKSAYPLKDSLAKMGMGSGSEEVLEHAFLSRAILNVQKRFSKKARGNEPAASPEEWLEKNLAP